MWLKTECRQTMLAGKLREMERQDEGLQRSIQTYGRQNHPQIRQALG